MIIRYTNGLTMEAVLLARTETTLRAVLKGSDDVREFTQINGTWVSEDCEPVHVEFAWMRRSAPVRVTEADCICSHQLAAHLIHLLYAGEDEPTANSIPSLMETPLLVRGLV